MTEKEQLILERYDKFLLENKASIPFMVAIMQLTLDYTNSGSIFHLKSMNNCSHQHIYKHSVKNTINGVNIYTKQF